MTLSHEEAKAYYDRFGLKQDTQKFYEDKAVACLVASATFGTAESVLEFGCGTGRIAERLLAEELPPTARYLALDISDTMIWLARERLARFGERAEIRRTGGEMRLPAMDGSIDRVLSTYVLDLLSEEDARQFLREAHRVLSRSGLLARSSLSHFAVNCETQAEIDEVWEKFADGGEEIECGWLRDRYGVSWQVVPAVLGEMTSDPDPERSKRVMQALIQMKKLDIDELERAYERSDPGETAARAKSARTETLQVPSAGLETACTCRRKERCV